MPEKYSRIVDVLWSDLDPNFHVRHSVYYDWGAFVRLSFLNENGLTPQVLSQHNVGPILFREECIFKRELHFGDEVEVFFYLQKCKPDMSRWTMQHEIWKNKDTLSAIITVDGAWIDTNKRKLTIPPEVIKLGIEKAPKTGDFSFI